jgi:hypothetical protein
MIEQIISHPFIDQMRKLPLRGTNGVGAFLHGQQHPLIRFPVLRKSRACSSDQKKTGWPAKKTSGWLIMATR